MKFIRKLLYVFPSKPIVLLPWFLAFVLSSVLEVIGIGIVGPFIGLANDPDLIYKNSWLSQIYKLLGFSQANRFIAFTGLLVIVIFCVKSLISWYVQSSIFKFTYIQREKLVTRLMYAYLNAPYILLVDKNSAQIIQNFFGQTRIFADFILSPLLALASNLVSILAVSVLLCLVSPLAVLSLLFMTVPLIFLFGVFKERIRLWGKEMYESEQELIRCINHSFGGFKETKVIGCGSYFAQEVIEQAHRYARASINYYAFKFSPRFVVESLLVAFVVGFTSISLLFQQNIQQLTPTLSIFALASLRLIPAFTGLGNSITVIRNNTHSLSQLYADLKELETSKLEIVSNRLSVHSLLEQFTEFNQTNSKFQLTQDIILNKVSYRYPTASNNALDSISLTIPKGKSIALIGRSGAGKTTLVDVLLGLLVPQTGEIQIDGVSIYDDLRAWQNLIGYIPQSIFLIDDTIERNIAFGVPQHLIDEQRLEKAIRAAQLTEVIENLPNGIKTRVGERGVMLSGGQRQRVGIARALYHEREILVLDEATSALDNETESLVTEAIKSLSGVKTMIIIAHRLTTVEHCDRIFLLEKGQVVKSGSYREIVLGEQALH